MITIELPRDLDRIVKERVTSGRYADEGEVLPDALRRLYGGEAAALADGLADLAAGRSLPLTVRDIIDQIDAEEA